ncbi:MAG: DUF6036 family nucleotidyltransferase, partial [Mycobacteriales bacterium]
GRGGRAARERMTREEFEHVVRAAAAIVADEIVVIGSQAIHGQVAAPPPALLVSRELDVYPRSAPERAAEIDGAIGDGSLFDSTYGYYAHGVGPETPLAPAGWQERLVRVELQPLGRQPGAVAWCMETHDLVLAKLVAGRPHDIEFALEALSANLADRAQLILELRLMPERHRHITKERLQGLLARIDRER